ncbi:MAG TPA: hypothetical protein PKY59_06240 [Pyrinomonadaceae bacterium]|nr:hypothetical protein [Pyrinomonadaceae bacterium]
MKRKAEITFEIEETIILRQAQRITDAFCPQCAKQVEMASPQTIADLSDYSEREIFRLVEAGKLHFIETERILICLDSLTVLKEW